MSAPTTIKGAALIKVGVKLAKLGVAREIEAKPGAPIWRRDDAGQDYALKLTTAGLKAIASMRDRKTRLSPARRFSPRRCPVTERVRRPAPEASFGSRQRSSEGTVTQVLLWIADAVPVRLFTL